MEHTNPNQSLKHPLEEETQENGSKRGRSSPTFDVSSPQLTSTSQPGPSKSICANANNESGVSPSFQYETRDPMQAALENDEVLKAIFSYLTTSKLLEFSLVSRLWQINARYILRNEKKCTAVIKSVNSKLCEEFRRFNFCIDHSQTIPYSGLSIIPVKAHDPRDKCVLMPMDVTTYEGKGVTSLYSSLFNNTNIKYLQVHNSKLLTGRLECPAVQFLSTILVDTSVNQNLRELSITNLPYGLTDFSALSAVFGPKFEITERNSWPKLKTLELSRSRIPRDKERVDPCIVDDMIFFAAPKLENITGYIRPENLECIFRHGRIEAVKQFAFYPTELSEEKLKLVAKFVKARTLLSVKKLAIFSISPFTQQILGDMMMKVCRTSSQLLAANMDWLTKLEIGHLDLIQLIRLRLLSLPLVLEKLSHLTIKYDTSLDIRDHLGEYFTLSRINYMRFFPNLEHLQLSGVRFANQDCVVAQGFWENPNSNFVSSSVTKLSFRDIPLDFIGYYIGRISLMFPNVTSLYVDNMNFEFVRLQQEFCSNLWISWPLLEDLTFSFIGFNTTAMGNSFVTADPQTPQWRSYNLDSCFTGFPISLIHGVNFDSANEFDDFLLLHAKEINPSITALKHLKRLRLQIRHMGKCRQNNLDENSYSSGFLSTLTGRMAFEKMPQLIVQVFRNVCRAPNCIFSLDHLRPYAKFVKHEFDLVDT